MSIRLELNNQKSSDFDYMPLIGFIDADATTTGYVKAFNPTTGSEAWRYPAGTGDIRAVASTPCFLR